MSRRKLTYWLIAASGLAILVITITLAFFDEAFMPEHEPVRTKSQMVVTAHPLASQAANTILEQGGSAVDAAIAAQLVLTLVEPHASGIGGGLFMLVAGPGGDIRAYDGREVAPKAVSPKMFFGLDGKPETSDRLATGGLAVGVPGAIAAMAMAHERYGKLPWWVLFKPAIQTAESGFPVSRLLSESVRELKAGNLERDMLGTYFRPDGSPLHIGEIIRDPAYARTLRIIAEGGGGAFYKGKIADEIVARVRSARNPGRMTVSDLADYRAIERKPICAPYREFKVCTTPTPSGGMTLLQILGMLRDQPSAQLKPGTVSQVHLFSQASKLAYADRAKWLGDPAFVRVPEEGLLDAGYLADRASKIDSRRDLKGAGAGVPPSKSAALPRYTPQRSPAWPGTSHLSIMDADGQAVSMTMSVQASFGAQLRVAGFVLNNELTDFSAEPQIDGQPVANAAAAGKRPLSAMSPAILFDGKGKIVGAIGSPGGRDIIAYNAQAIIDLLDTGSIAGAVSRPHFANFNGPTYLEKRSSLIRMIPRLIAMGNSVRLQKFESGLNGIWKTANGLEGASDVRGEGLAVGK